MAGGTRRRWAPCRRNKDIRIKAIVDNFDNYTIIDYLTALSYWVDKQLNKVLFLYFYIESKIVDETGLDEPKVGETAVDEITVDKPGPLRLVTRY